MDVLPMDVQRIIGQHLPLSDLAQIAQSSRQLSTLQPTMEQCCPLSLEFVYQTMWDSGWSSRDTVEQNVSTATTYSGKYCWIMARENPPDIVIFSVTELHMYLGDDIKLLAEFVDSTALVPIVSQLARTGRCSSYQATCYLRILKYVFNEIISRLIGWRLENFRSSLIKQLNRRVLSGAGRAQLFALITADQYVARSKPRIREWTESKPDQVKQFIDQLTLEDIGSLEYWAADINTLKQQGHIWFNIVQVMPYQSPTVDMLALADVLWAANIQEDSIGEDGIEDGVDLATTVNGNKAWIQPYEPDERVIVEPLDLAIYLTEKPVFLASLLSNTALTTIIPVLKQREGCANQVIECYVAIVKYCIDIVLQGEKDWRYSTFQGELLGTLYNKVFNDTARNVLFQLYVQNADEPSRILYLRNWRSTHGDIYFIEYFKDHPQLATCILNALSAVDIRADIVT